MAVTCNWCSNHVSNRDYREAWDLFLRAGWDRERIRDKSPSCTTCAGQIIHAEKQKEEDDNVRR